MHTILLLAEASRPRSHNHRESMTWQVARSKVGEVGVGWGEVGLEGRGDMAAPGRGYLFDFFPWIMGPFPFNRSSCWLRG